MATYTHVFADEETTNWFKAYIALVITKEGLADLVDQVIQNVQTIVGRGCGNCSTENLIKCPTSGICKTNRNHCNFHSTPAKQYRPCPTNMCNQVVLNIKAQHRYPLPSWKNTKAEQWATNHWEIAKCFCPPDGYLHVTSVEDTDFNGVINILLNCRYFSTLFSFCIASSTSTQPCRLTEARCIGRDVRHTPDCKVNGAVLHGYFVTLTALLADPSCLIQDPTAQKALIKLRQLDNDSLTINHIEMGRLLKEAQETLRISRKVAVESRRQIADQLSKAVADIQSTMANCHQAIDALTQQSIEKMSAAEKSAITRIGQIELGSEIQHSDKNVKEFFQRLTQHYEQVLSNVQISPFVKSIDRNLRVLYSKPTLKKISRHNTLNIYVNCYNAVFYKDNTLNGRIYIQGEAGVGKSTFTAKLTLDWLCLKSSSQNLTSTFEDVQTLDAFDFVFYVTLRDSADHRDIVQMINEQLINMIYTDEYRGAIYKLLQYIMQKYRCLVVLDGLDEWSDPNGHIAVPLMASSNILCTLLITTRPWKMTDERIKDSHIDILLEIEGVENPDLLSERIIGCLFNNEMELKHSDFIIYIMKHQLFDLLNSPTMLTLIVCLWADGVFLKGSRCEIYSHILDCLLKKARSRIAIFEKPPFDCFRNTSYCYANVAVIEALSTVAFALFLADRTEISKSFSNRELMKYLSEDQKACALTSGILSERKHNSFARINSTFCFVHRPMQEFLAAYYIANKPHVIDDEIANSIFKYNNLNLDISQTYIFLCGLNIKAAEKLSYVVNITCSTNSHLGRTTQNMILAGYKEAISNNNKDIDFRPSLSFFYFYSNNHTYANYMAYDAKDLARILLANKSNVKSISLNSDFKEIGQCKIQDIITSSAHCIERLELDGDYGELDLSTCYNLEVLNLRGHTSFPTDSLFKLRKLKRLALLSERQALPIDTLPPSIQQVNVRDDVYSFAMLRSLMNTIYSQDLHMYCNIDTFDDGYQQIENQEVMFNRPILHTVRKDMSNVCDMSGIGLKCFGFGNGVYEALIGAPIRRLSIIGIPNAPLLFRILPTLTGLEELNVSTMDFCCDLKLPQAIRLINFDPIICSSSSLANFVASVSAFKHTIKCNMRICKMEQNKKPLLVICPEWFSSPPEVFLQQTHEEVSIKYNQVDYFGMAEALVSVIKDCLPTGLTLDKPEKGFSRVRRYMTGFIKQKLNAIENSKELLASDSPVLCKLSIRHEDFLKEDKAEETKRNVHNLRDFRNISTLAVRCTSNDTSEIIKALSSQRSIKCATFVGMETRTLLSDAFPMLINLKKIRIITCPWLVTPNVLRRVLSFFFYQSVHLQMLFPFEDPIDLFFEIEKNLSVMKNVDVIRFSLLRGRFIRNYHNDNDVEADDYKLITPLVNGKGNQFLSLKINFNFDEFAGEKLLH